MTALNILFFYICCLLLKKKFPSYFTYAVAYVTYCNSKLLEFTKSGTKLAAACSLIHNTDVQKSRVSLTFHNKMQLLIFLNVLFIYKTFTLQKKKTMSYKDYTSVMIKFPRSQSALYARTFPSSRNVLLYDIRTPTKLNTKKLYTNSFSPQREPKRFGSLCGEYRKLSKNSFTFLLISQEFTNSNTDSFQSSLKC